MIGQKAATLINEGDNIALDSSTTCLELAKNIENKQLSVLTNGMQVVTELGQRSNITMLCTGGYFNEDQHAFFGHIAEKAMEGFHVDKLFLSCKGFHVNWGTSESHEQQAILKRKMLSISDEVNLLVDSSKINVKALIQTATLDKIDRIITDDGIKPATVNLIEKHGIEVMVCK
jgi:DeoR/GlpR family transcriptional regulator of sugar metabolism